MNLFLETIVYNASSDLSPEAVKAILAVIAVLGIFFFIIGLAVYIYSSFAYMAIARRNKQNAPGLAWIPFVGPLIVAYRASKMSSWPWWLLLGFIVSAIPYVGFIGFIALLVFVVYAVIWHWKMFEAVGRAGWWAIISFLIWPVGLILLGIAAWGED